MPDQSPSTKNKPLKFISASSVFVSDTAFFLISLAIIAVAAYFFGFNLLREPTIGNDALNTLKQAVWINEHFPNVPLWYPLSGGGSSFMLGYPVLYARSVVILHRLTNLNLFSSMAILNFASVLLSAWGVFAFVFFRFRLRVAALLAGLFYLLSPMTYVLISGAAFLAHAYANIFAVPFLIFFDSFINGHLEKRSIRRQLITLLLAGIFFILGMLAHPVSVLGIMVVYGFYVVLVGLMSGGVSGLPAEASRAPACRRGREHGRIGRRGTSRAKAGLLRGIGGYLIASIVLFLLIYFWYQPFSKYSAFSNRDMSLEANVGVMPPVELRGILGLLGKTPDYQYPFPNLSIVPFVWGVAGIGAILGLVKYVFYLISKASDDEAIKRKKAAIRVFVLGIIGFFSIYQMGTYDLWVLVSKIHWFIGFFFVNRYYYTPTMVLPPIVAGIGVWYLASLPFAPISLLIKRLGKYFAAPFKAVIFFLTLGLALGITGFGLWKLSPYSGLYNPEEPWILHYGEELGVDTKHIWNRPYPVDPCLFPPGDNRRSRYCDDSMVKKYVDVGMLKRVCEKNTPASDEEAICHGGRKDASEEWIAVQEKDFLDFSARCADLPPFFFDPISMKLQEAVDDGRDNPYYLADICLAFSRSPEEQIKNWPWIRLPENRRLADLSTASFADPENPNHFLSQEGVRIDITPSLGTWVKEWGINNRSSIVNAYTGQLVLNKSFQSYFIDAMYSRDLIKIPLAVDEMAKYFGTTGVIITGGDQTEKFQARGWEKTGLGEGGAFFHPPFEANLFSLEMKPLVLVIGSLERQAYQQVFRAATMGGLSFDEAILVEGRERLDSYSAAELAGFETLILHGYRYRNRNKAFKLLEDYVRQGGRVFIDTGWQYVASDWGGKKGVAEFPEVVPVAQTQWGEADRGWEAGNLRSGAGFDEGVSLADFDPLIWDGVPWKLASADSGAVRGWAQPILTLDEKVIMAGGSPPFAEASGGKIIWSGMNFVSHARDSENPAEIKLLNNIFKFLLGSEAPESSPRPRGSSKSFSYSREPDQLTINFNQNVPKGASFYFREAFYPYWRAQFISRGTNKSLPVLTAGPRFMLARLSEVSAGDQLVFSFVPDSSYTLARIISLITFISLILALLDSLFNRSRVLGWFENRLSPLVAWFVNRAKRMKEGFGGEEDEDY